ncbi:hypothetical protein SAMD00019534_038800, partial [Acytostelium subglobosum LB1]|uniref:hypothetical protein n=1 Tax=Acytostelium subglobosum LB1 TaxID=1410327 RepID=UPI0006451B03
MGNRLSQLARDRIYLCKRSNDRSDLNLSSCGLNRVPRRIQRFRRTLTKLNVGKNFLSEFNKYIERFYVLETLIADSNELKIIWPGLSQLQYLKHLDVSNNLLTMAPSYLNSLIHLNISYNSIQSFPNGIQLPVLEELLYSHNRVSLFPTPILELSHLHMLDMSGNQLAYIPDEISQLAGTLRHLDISDNQFTSFPPSVATLIGLRSLRLAGNNLGTLSPSFTSLVALEILDLHQCSLISFDFDLGNLENLTELSLSENRLLELSITTSNSLGLLKKMKNLDLSSNQLTTIPKQVGWLTNLRRLNLSQNQLTRVPGELSLLNPSIDIILVPNPLEYPFCEWIKDGMPLFLQSIRPMMKCYGPNCYVSGLEKSLSANAPNQFFIHSIDYAGVPRVSGGDIFDVKMILDGSESPDLSGANTNSSRASTSFYKDIVCIVKDNFKAQKTATYSVFFNSPQTGSYAIHISSDGCPITGSPFSLELV